MDISFSSVNRTPTPVQGGARTSPDSVSEQVVISAADSYSAESLQRLEETAQHAVEHFRRNFGPVNRPLRFEVGGSGLRAGYNPGEDTIFLPELGNVREAGLHSNDVINHEIFHALVLNAYPELPKPGDAKESDIAMHEALADYFAYGLSPDPHFGEDYRTDRTHLREYSSELKLGLAPGSHAQGNAIVSMMLEHGITATQIRDFLQAGDFRLEALAERSETLAEALEAQAKLAITDEVSAPYQRSSSNKYWLQKDAPLQFQLTPNEKMREEFPGLRIVWTNKLGYPSSHYTVEVGPGNSYTVRPKEGARVEKMLASFYDGESIIGFRQFYFGLRADGDPALE